MRDETIVKDRIEGAGKLVVAIPQIQSMSHEEYALARKNYLGASDSSILCGVNLYKNLDQLIKEKNTKYLTDEEKEVSEKAIVRKGYDLEPIILNKATEALTSLGYIGMLYKPEDMYTFKDVKGLSVNYDGVWIDTDNMFPVEAKLVSKWGEKYYNKSITIEQAKQIDMKIEGDDLSSHIKKKANKFGIPAYYYTQVQQELAGLDAPYGYLAAMFDDSWDFKIYYIKRDDYTISKLYQIAENVIQKINRN